MSVSKPRNEYSCICSDILLEIFCSAQQTYNCADRAYVWEKLADNFMVFNDSLKYRKDLNEGPMVLLWNVFTQNRQTNKQQNSGPLSIQIPPLLFIPTHSPGLDGEERPQASHLGNSEILSCSMPVLGAKFQKLRALMSSSK